LPLAYLVYTYNRGNERESWEEGDSSVKYPYGPTIPSKAYLKASMAHPCCADETQTAALVLEMLHQQLSDDEIMKALTDSDGRTSSNTHMDGNDTLSNEHDDERSRSRSKPRPCAERDNQETQRWKSRRKENEGKNTSKYQQASQGSPLRHGMSGMTARERLAERLKRQATDIVDI